MYSILLFWLAFSILNAVIILYSYCQEKDSNLLELIRIIVTFTILGPVGTGMLIAVWVYIDMDRE